MLTPVFRHFAREVACPSGLSLRGFQLTGADAVNLERLTRPSMGIVQT